MESSLAVDKKRCRHLIHAVWELNMQKLAVLSTCRIYNSVFKKTIKRKIAVVEAGNDSRPAGRFLSMEGQGESKSWLVALPKIGRSADMGAGENTRGE